MVQQNLIAVPLGVLSVVCYPRLARSDSEEQLVAEDELAVPQHPCWNLYNPFRRAGNLSRNMDAARFL